MTDEIQADPTATIEGTGPVLVQPDTGSRLEQLHARYAEVKAAADAANEQLKAVTDGIKAELAQAAPGQPKIELTGASGPALRLTYSETWRFDSRKFKAVDPETYVRFAKKTGSWTLKAAQGGASE